LLLEDGSSTLPTQPSISDLGEKLGLQPKASQSLYDLAIIGAIRLGWRLRCMAAPEGLEIILHSTNAPGWQAGTSSRIEITWLPMA